MDVEERPKKLRKLVHDPGPRTAEEADADVKLEAEHSKSDELTINGAGSASEDGNSEAEDASEDNGEVKEGISGDAGDAGDAGPTPPISKNQLKKLRKREDWEAGREYRKTKRKQKAAEKKVRKREAREEEAAVSLVSNGKQPRIRHVRLPITFLIDCGFDDLMAEKEIISLGSQLTRSYSDNHRAPFQAHLAISSWGGLLKQRFDSVLSKHYLNWRGVRFEEDDFAVVAEKAKDWMNGKAGGKLAGTFANYDQGSAVPQKARSASTEDIVTKVEDAREGDPTNDALPPLDPKSLLGPDGAIINSIDTEVDFTTKSLPAGEIIYLTSDSPFTLTELKPYGTYIVGGLVDKNRHKGICYKTALDKGIETAKLPIGQYMNMQSRFVLATNHVVEIMIKWLECGDWGQAFLQVIPKRKGGSLKGEDKEDDEPQ